MGTYTASYTYARSMRYFTFNPSIYMRSDIVTLPQTG